MKPIVHRARPRDVSELAALEAHVFGQSAWSERALRSLVEGADSIILFESRSPIAGYAAFRTVLEESELLRVAVRPLKRRRGLARRPPGARLRVAVRRRDHHLPSGGARR